MKATLMNGKVKEFVVGNATTGHHFAAVEFTREDAGSPVFRFWVENCVWPRLIPPLTKKAK